MQKTSRGIIYGLMPNIIENLDELRELISEHKLTVSVDIGGSLIKIIIFKDVTREPFSLCHCQLALFDLSQLEKVIGLLSRASTDSAFAFLGGGAFKERDFIVNNFSPTQLHFIDEMESISRGAIYLGSSGHDKSIVVNVGSGISTLRINSASKENCRISGSCIGGGTFMGLIKACVSDVLSFQEAISLATKGRSDNCDLLVKDIYGDSYPGLTELPGNLVASSMGKFTSKQDPESVAASILNMIVIHIAQVASFAAQLYLDHQLLFSGSFFSDKERFVESQLKLKLSYWNLEGNVLPLNPFVGCIGALCCITNNFYSKM